MGKTRVSAHIRIQWLTRVATNSFHLRVPDLFGSDLRLHDSDRILTKKTMRPGNLLKNAWAHPNLSSADRTGRRS
jgi:hypothetical protein